MKIALVTNAASQRSGIADYTRHLLPYLAEHCEIELFVEAGLEGEEILGRPTYSIAGLNPRDYDQLLYQLGNEAKHAFMVPALRKFGGTVAQHDWVLFDMVVNAFPGLQRGGPKGATLAAREGGAKQLKTYVANWRDRRRGRVKPFVPPSDRSSADGLLYGWHGPESHGRWISDVAGFRIPGRGVSGVRVALNLPPKRTVALLGPSGELDRQTSRPEAPWAVFECEAETADHPLFELRVAPVRVTDEQRRHGDARRLAACIEKIEWRDADGEHELDLSGDSLLPIQPVTLSRDRFELTLNRSVVKSADASIVHSQYVANGVRSLRGANTPIAIVPHGAERRWHDEPRHKTRVELGLPSDWHDAFMLVSFGGVQAHKRIDRALEGFAAARRECPELRMAMVGPVSTEGFDAREVSRRLGLEDAVHFTGFVAESEVWRWLHAGDAGINLRGPTSGGTSGGIYQSFSFGRPVIVSDAAEQSELPNDCTIKVPLGSGEVDAIAAALIDLRSNPERRRRLEAGARRYVDEECHWSHCAKLYAEALARFPKPRSAR